MSLLSRIARATALTVILLATPASAENKKAVLSQAFQSMLYLPLYVAIDEGFFTQQGLDLTKETAGAPTVALSAVISGSAQFSIHGPEWTAIAASKGAPVNIIANVVNGAAVWIATTPDFKFESIKDIKGQKVVTGLMPTTSTSLFIKLLKENGMDAKTDVEMIQVAIGSEPGPFVAKQADIAVMYEPGLDQAVAKGMKVVLGFLQLFFQPICLLHQEFVGDLGSGGMLLDTLPLVFLDNRVGNEPGQFGNLVNDGNVDQTGAPAEADIRHLRQSNDQALAGGGFFHQPNKTRIGSQIVCVDYPLEKRPALELLRNRLQNIEAAKIFTVQCPIHLENLLFLLLNFQCGGGRIKDRRPLDITNGQ